MTNEIIIPDSWAWVSVSEIGQFIRGVSYDKRDVLNMPANGYVPILRATNFDNGKLSFDELVYIPESYVDEQQFIRSDDIIIAMSSGSKKLVGKAAQVQNDYNASFGTFCGLVRLVSQINRRYVAYFFQSQDYRNQISKLSTGININNLRKEHIESLNVPLPPLLEQHRIVAKIEELFSRLDAGVEALREAQSMLKHYRTSILEAAVKGQLMPKNGLVEKVLDEKYESAYELVRQILIKRKELCGISKPIDTCSEEKNLQDHEWEEKCDRPIVIDEFLPEFPNWWILVPLELLWYDASYGISEKCDYNGEGPIVLRIPNIRDNKIDLNDLKRSIKPMHINAYDSLQYGDFLVIRTNGSKDLIGRGALIPKDFRNLAYFASYLIRLRLIPHEMLPEWISIIWDSRYIRSFILAKSATSAGQYNISLTALAKLKIPIPPVNEQQIIIENLGQQLSVIDHLESSISTALKHAAILRNSILNKAFTGRLVPQDPTDEPASKLLERIKAERARMEAEQPRRRKRRAN